LSNILKYKGTIVFDIDNFTKKHLKQSSWKRMAFVMLENSDILEYYRWFIYKRYNLKLNKPLRDAHISFINDSINDIMNGLNCSEEIAEQKYNEFKVKYNNKQFNIYLDVDARANKDFWWLNIPEEYRIELHNIRKEIGLNRPYFGLHMTIGTVKPLDYNHNNYIIDNIKKFGFNYN
jgi:hypothetical protein